MTDFLSERICPLCDNDAVQYTESLWYMFVAIFHQLTQRGSVVRFLLTSMISRCLHIVAHAGTASIAVPSRVMKIRTLTIFVKRWREPHAYRLSDSLGMH